MLDNFLLMYKICKIQLYIEMIERRYVCYRHIESIWLKRTRNIVFGSEELDIKGERSRGGWSVFSQILDTL
jgi:hypothetical protein